MATAGEYSARAALVSSESGRLLGYFRGLSAADWAAPSACEAWSNADVAAHLVMAVDMFSGNIARGLGGDCSPPPGMGPPQETDLAARMAANAGRAVSMRESLGDGLVDAFAAQCRRLDELLVGVGDDDWDKPCYHPAAMLTVGRYLNLRLTEMAVHEWDIRSGLEAGARLPDVVMPAVLELLPGFVVGRLFQPGAGLERAVRFRFELSDGGAYDIVAGGGELRMEGALPEVGAEVVFRCDASTFALLAYGRFGVAGAVAAGDLVVAGDRGLAGRF